MGAQVRNEIGDFHIAAKVDGIGTHRWIDFEPIPFYVERL